MKSSPDRHHDIKGHSDVDCDSSAKTFLESIASGEQPTAEQIQAWESIYREFTPRIRIIARRFARDRNDRDDLVQEVWFVLINRIMESRFDPSKGSITGWMTTVAINTMRNMLKSSKIFAAEHISDEQWGVLSDPDIDPVRECESAQVRLIVRQTLTEFLEEKSISEPNKTIIVLHTLEERSYAEIASVLGMTTKQVRKRYNRTMKNLSSLVERLRRRIDVDPVDHSFMSPPSPE